MKYQTYITELKLNDKQKTLYNEYREGSKLIYDEFIKSNLELLKLRSDGDNTKNYRAPINFLKYYNKELLLTEEWAYVPKLPLRIVHAVVHRAHQAMRLMMYTKHNAPTVKDEIDPRTCVPIYRMGAKNYFETTARHTIKIPSLGTVITKNYGYIQSKGDIMMVHIRERAGRYYGAFVVKGELQRLPPSEDFKVIGIDLGIKQLVTTSDNDLYANPIHLPKVVKLLARIAKEKKKLKKMSLGSANYIKQCILLGEINHKLTEAIRGEHYRIITDILNKKPTTIVIEDLNIESMIQKTPGMESRITAARMRKFVELLKQKCYKHNIEIVIADRYFPSTKRCSNCGVVKKTMELKQRTFICECGLEIDRDLNAAINLKELATERKT